MYCMSPPINARKPIKRPISFSLYSNIKDTTPAPQNNIARTLCNMNIFNDLL